MDEQGKHAILFAATLLSAPKLMDIMDSDRPNMSRGYWVDKAIDEAAFVLERIDKRWPMKSDRSRRGRFGARRQFRPQKLPRGAAGGYNRFPGKEPK